MHVKDNVTSIIIGKMYPTFLTFGYCGQVRYYTHTYVFSLNHTDKTNFTSTVNDLKSKCLPVGWING